MKNILLLFLIFLGCHKDPYSPTGFRFDVAVQSVYQENLKSTLTELSAPDPLTVTHIMFTVRGINSTIYGPNNLTIPFALVSTTGISDMFELDPGDYEITSFRLGFISGSIFSEIYRGILPSDPVYGIFASMVKYLLPYTFTVLPYETTKVMADAIYLDNYPLTIFGLGEFNPIYIGTVRPLYFYTGGSSYTMTITTIPDQNELGANPFTVNKTGGVVSAFYYNGLSSDVSETVRFNLTITSGGITKKYYVSKTVLELEAIHSYIIMSSFNGMWGFTEGFHYTSIPPYTLIP